MHRLFGWCWSTLGALLNENDGTNWPAYEANYVLVRKKKEKLVVGIQSYCLRSIMYLYVRIKVNHVCGFCKSIVMMSSMRYERFTHTHTEMARAKTNEKKKKQTTIQHRLQMCDN